MKSLNDLRAQHGWFTFPEDEELRVAIDRINERIKRLMPTSDLAGFKDRLIRAARLDLAGYALSDGDGYRRRVRSFAELPRAELDAARARASTDQLLVDDSASLTMADLAVRVKRLHLRHAIQFVVVDYVQLLTAGLRTENRTQELAYISRQLKALAKELHIAGIVVAQLNRDYDKRADKRPRMSDLEGSS